MELELAPEGWFGFVALELDDGLEELDEDEDGVLLEPAPAEPLGLDGLLDEDEPPLAWSFLLMSIEVDEELEPAPGVVVAPEGAVDDELDERSAARSHAAISDAPSARETATAMVESLMWPPWLGYRSSSKYRAAIVTSQPAFQG